VTADVRAAVDVAWRTILNREPRPEADFFRSGGDSLLLVRFVTHLRNAGIGAQPVDVLKGRTFDRITGLVAQRAAVPSVGSAAASETRPAPVPLLPAQARWLGNRFTEPDQFSLGGVFHLPEAPADLSGALAALVDRHEALRTRYVLDGDGGATAEVLPSLPEDPVVTADVTDAEVPEVLKAAHKRHDLAAGKVLAATWLPAQRLLHIALHHLTLDGYSVDLVVDDLERLLQGEKSPGPAAQPRDYTGALEKWVADADHRMWDGLNWASVRVVPTEMDGPAHLPSTNIVSHEAGRQATAALTALAGELGTGVDHLMTGAACHAIAERFGLTGVGVDAYHHNRDGAGPGWPDLTATVGYLQSTFPVVFPAGKAVDWAERSASAVAAVPAARFSFDALRFGTAGGALNPPSSLVRMNFRGRMNQLSERRGAWLRPADVPAGGRRSPRQVEPYRLMLEGDQVEDTLVFSVKYSRDQYSDETISALAARTVELIEAVS
jgi:hypothetical protein